MNWLRRNAITLAAALLASAAMAQQCTYEAEPNDTPAQATLITGEGPDAVAAAGHGVLGVSCFAGSLSGQDQDAFLWVVDEAAAAHTWRVEVEGPRGGLTQLDIFAVEFAENGTDVVRADGLFRFGTADGSGATSEEFLVPPGRYVIGMSQAGASGEYVVNLRPTRISQGRSEFREGRSQSGAFSLFGALEGGFTVPFTVSEDQTGYVWAVDFQAPIGAAPTLTIEGRGGSIASLTAAGSKSVRLANLGLTPGEYRAHVAPSSDGETGFVSLALAAVGRATDGVEIEPNDRWDQASWFELGGEVRGVAENVDYYVFEVPGGGDAPAGSELVEAWDLNLAAEADVQLALFDADQRPLLERNGSRGTVRALQLQPGAYYVRVRGSGDVPYVLSFSPSTAAEQGFEREPNDRVEVASPMGPEGQVRGELWAQDLDYFRLEVTGDAQRFRLQVVGKGVEELALYDAGGSQLARATGEGRIRLDDLILLPGANYVRVRGGDGEYALRALSLGPAPEPTPSADAPAKDEPLTPVPASEGGEQSALEAAEAPTEAALPALPPPPPGLLETEPNDDGSRAQRLVPGVVHVGRLSSASDIDRYRFHLDVEQYVRIELAPPEGASGWWLSLDGTSYRSLPASEGGVIAAHKWLLAGDHQVELRGSWIDEAPSDYYQLRLMPLGSLGLPVDLEPNDSVATASQLPAELRWSGHVGEARDRDHYRLPLFAVDTTISLDANAGEDVWFDVLKDGDGSFSESENGLLTQTIPAGQQTYLRVNGDGAYELSLDFSSRPDPSALLPPRDGGELEVALRLEDQEAAAFWHQGQRLTGTIDVTNHGSSAITAELTAAADAAGVRFQLPGDASVPAGGSLSLPVTVELPADVSDQAPVALQVAASGGSSLAVGGYDLPLRCEAPPVKPFAYSAIPPSLLGRPNVLFAGLGAAVPDGFETQRRDAFINDGRTTVAHGAWAGDGHSPTFRLAGDGPVTLLGTVINPASDSETERQLRTFRIETSLDGVGYQTAFEGRLSGARVDQAFVFDAPIEARFARLVAVDSQRGDAEGFFGEWKLIADEPALISGLDLSTPELGGHLVWSRPLLGEGASVDILTETSSLMRLDLLKEDAFTMVVGFAGTRAARVASLSLTQPEGAPEQLFDAVEVAFSMTGAAGPWQPLTESALGAVGTTTLIELETPTWARYVRLSFPKRDDQRNYLAPVPLSIFEAPSEGGYLSVLAEWGTDTTAGPYELLEGRGEIEPSDGVDAGDSAEEATPLAAGVPVTGTVAVAEDVDWYRISVPDGENHVTVRLSGDPAIAYAYQLTAADGSAVPVQAAEDGHDVVLSAFVEPGDYLLRLEEPKRTVIFSWDTSGSVSPYQAITYSSLASFARGVDGEREAVQLLAFDAPSPQWLLPYWSTDPQRVQRAITEWGRDADSSDSERALLTATRALRDREGTKAVLFMTDAETSGRALTPELWEALEEVRPRVFTFEISSGGNRYPQQLMQSWAAVNSGAYQMSRGVGHFDAGFARASCLLRRPKRYTVEVTTAAVEPPGPGTLSVLPAQDAGTPGVHVIFDASGSMGQLLPSGEARIAAAKRALDELVGSSLEEGTPFSLRAFGHVAPNSCETRLDVPLAPLDRAAAHAAVAAIEPKLLSQTAIADSLSLAVDDLASAAGPRTVILITDGAESCGGDPAAAAAELRAAGDTAIAIVSLALEPDGLAVFEGLAEEIDATYVDVGSFEGLSEALTAALSPAFEVFDQAGELVATGRVGDSVELPMGLYSVRVMTAPVQVFEDVMVPGDGAVRLTAEGR